MGNSVKSEDTTFYWGRPGSRPGIHLTGGFLSVREDGIFVGVDDDYYSGNVSREDAQKIYLALKKMFG